MLVGAVQTDVIFADVPANLNRTLAAIETAGERGIELLVFPECVLTGYAYDSRESALQIAIELDSSPIRQIRETARKAGVSVTLGFLEKATDGAGKRQLFNTALALGPANRCDSDPANRDDSGPNGSGVSAAADSIPSSSEFEIRSHYRKIHLPHLGVDRFVDRGDRPYQADLVGKASVGLAICYDCSFPEPMRLLGLAGADIVALGTNWPVAAARTADVVPPARSMENHYYFIAANRIGHENGFDFCGRSSICGPDGVVLAQADGNEDTVLTAEIDLSVARNKTIQRTAGAHVIDRFADRRPEFYEPIAKANLKM